jgi:hypothetical protein
MQSVAQRSPFLDIVRGRCDHLSLIFLGTLPTELPARPMPCPVVLIPLRITDGKSQPINPGSIKLQLELVLAMRTPLIDGD